MLQIQSKRSLPEFISDPVSLDTDLAHTTVTKEGGYGIQIEEAHDHSRAFASIRAQGTPETMELWNVAAMEPTLKAAFIETSFPDELAELALVSKHLTPSLLSGAFQKIGRPDLTVSQLQCSWNGPSRMPTRLRASFSPGANLRPPEAPESPS